MSDSHIQALEKVALNRDFYNGDVEYYLSRWTKEDVLKYRWRLDNTYFMNYVEPTVNGLNNLLFRKAVEVNGVPDEYVKNISETNDSLEGFIRNTSQKAIRDGFTLISAETTVTSKSANNYEEVVNDVRGFIQNYTVDQIVNYRFLGNKLTQITLRSVIALPDGDFGEEEVEQYKVYRVGGGELFIKRAESDELESVGVWENGLDFIPIVPLYMGNFNGHFDCKSCISHIAKLNKAHYNIKSGIMNICHIASNPIPKLFGSITNKSLVIGVNEPLHFEDKESSDFQWEEISGSSVKISENEVNKLEEYIYKQSFSILKDDPYQTATQARFENSKGRGILNNFAENIESSFTTVLEYLAIITGQKIDPEIKVNDDFDDLLIDPNTIANIINLKDKNMISFETLWDTLVRGEILKSDFDGTREKQLIESEEMLGLGGQDMGGEVIGGSDVS